ncbi:hypothetical protein GGX14DRAFT_544364 [Mycena pura]|uniref:Uncharacterized protein n=1 Tax=Mycena pura TaxID=153505 RepID=A0AAD6YAY7_9AGAR|nr:hypothetical protein GGX14DRAFT_544364 [Mycena pura]
MWAVLSFAACIALWPPLVVGQANRTVDDSSPQITYAPASAVTHGNLTGFDISKLYNGTISIMDATEIPSVNMTMNFIGSALWVFINKPQTEDQYVIGYKSYLDGVNVDQNTYISNNRDAEYAIVACSNTSMDLGPHTFTLEATDLATYFDYAVFTSNDPTPETTIPPIQSASAASAAIGGATGKTKPPSQPSGSPSQAADALNKNATVARIAGAAAAGVVVLAAGIVALLLLKRRRARARGVKPHYGANGGNAYPGGAYGAHGAGGAQASDMSMAQASDATPLHAQASQYSPGSMPSTQEYNMPYAAQGQPQDVYPASQNTYPPQAQMHYPPPGPPYMRSDYPVQAYGPGAPSLSSPQPSPYSSSPEAAAQYDPESNTLAYVPSAEQEPQLQRMLAEQRAVQAEYTRPDPAQWGDEKAAMRRNASMGALAGGPHVMNPGSPNSGIGPGVARSGTARTAGGNGDVYPASPLSAYGHAQAQARDAAALSTIAAEMVALRAHVARLETHGQRADEDGFGAPPAYN